jgi:hypothetical protein
LGVHESGSTPGTFTALDSYAGEAVDPVSLNRYLYAHANPATLIDPTGHAACEFDGCAYGHGDESDPGSSYQAPSVKKTNHHGPAKPTAPTHTGGTSGGSADAGGAMSPPIRDDERLAIPSDGRLVGNVWLNEDGIARSDQDQARLYHLCFDAPQRILAACIAFDATNARRDAANSTFCQDSQDVCQLRIDELVLTAAFMAELVGTGILLADLIPGDETALATGTIPATLVQLQVVKDRLAAIATRSSIPTSAAGRQSLWTRVQAGGVRVYQRQDLIDPSRVDGTGKSNLQRMQAGRPPIGPDGRPINLHHGLQTQDGPIFEMTETMHLSSATRGIVHINPSSFPSGIDRTVFARWRRDYWVSRACDFGGC